MVVVLLLVTMVTSMNHDAVHTYKWPSFITIIVFVFRIFKSKMPNKFDRLQKGFKENVSGIELLFNF